MEKTTKVALELPAKVNTALEKWCEAFSERHHGARQSKVRAIRTILTWALTRGDDEGAWEALSADQL
jgi:hypothetical protein